MIGGSPREMAESAARSISAAERAVRKAFLSRECDSDRPMRRDLACLASAIVMAGDSVSELAEEGSRPEDE